MAEPASRVSDHGLSDSGSRGLATKGSPDVDINDKPALRVCDVGKGETGACTGQEWEPIMGSGTVEVNGKPLVRRTDETQHFACGPGRMIDGSPDVEAGGPGVLQNQAAVDALVKYIYDQMMKNKDDPRIKRILLNNQMFQSSLTSGGMPDLGSEYRALDQFKDLVGYKKPFDQKADIVQSYGQWSYDPATNTSVQYDTWSNVHYGFVGGAAGFDDPTLLNGAGLAQWLNDNKGASALDKAGKYGEFATGGDTARYDEPTDQEAIKIGSDLWKKYQKDGKLTEADVKDAILKSTKLKAFAGHAC
jgi:uncharacterized Zn-binding protein involved in type VI secretion